MPWEERKRQRQTQRVQGSQQSRRRLPASLLEIPEGSTAPNGKNKRNRLTVSDWMRVYAYMDTLGSQPIKQQEVVDYFATRPEDPLFFSRVTLSRKLKRRPEIEAHVESNPHALSRKRSRTPKSPDVECELLGWVQLMQQKGAVVKTGMLIERRKVLEEKLNVPGDKRLTGHGWVQSFCHA